MRSHKDALIEMGDAVKFIRRARGLSQEKLAEQSEVSTAFINMLENGKADNPGLKSIRKVAWVLRVPDVILISPGMYGDLCSLMDFQGRVEAFCKWMVEVEPAVEWWKNVNEIILDLNVQTRELLDKIAEEWQKKFVCP